MTLLPGDVVATGAPGASGPVDTGDRVEIRIGGVGALKNTVVRL
jgi:2-keto-4-pentenoate hydratase/2-oxohepta-3-ene-1,7-dioic acid hydratase in catechol pathway